MPRDLFAQSLAGTRGPARLKWTIAGSVLAHVALVTALLVMPVLAALDNYVLNARGLMFVVPPPLVVPAMTASPPTMKSLPTDIDPAKAPSQPAQEPVTTDVVSVSGGGPPGLLAPIGNGRDFLDSGPGPVTIPSVVPPPVKVVPVRPGGNIQTPTRTHYVAPIYPTIAQAVKDEGIVILEATIDEFGVVRDVKVLRSKPLLDQAAIEAVSKWRYTPTRLNGVAVPIILTVTVNFALR